MAEAEIQTRRRRGRAELIAALAEARSGMRRDTGDMADLVNVPQRIRKTIAEAPLARAGGALIAGIVGSRLLTGRKRRADGPSGGTFRSLFPDFDFRGILRLLLKAYLEPDEVDLKALLRERLREYLK